MSQVKKYQGGGQYDDIDSLSDLRKQRRLDNQHERLYRRKMRAVKNQTSHPTEAREARINKLGQRLLENEAKQAIQDGLNPDAVNQANSNQQASLNQQPAQQNQSLLTSEDQTYGGFMRERPNGSQEYSGDNYYLTQSPHIGKNYLVWGGKKILWTTKQAERMQNWLKQINPEDRQFLSGVVNALNAGYDVAYDPNSMRLLMPDQFYNVKGPNALDRLKKEQTGIGAFLGGLFNSKMANYRDSIAQLSRYAITMENMDFSPIDGLPEVSADGKQTPLGDDWRTNPNYNKMMQRLDAIKKYLDNPQVAMEVYDELPEDKQWLLDEHYKNPQFYENLKDAMINGTLTDEQREFLNQIGIVSKKAAPPSKLSKSGTDPLKTTDGDETDGNKEVTIASVLQDKGFTDNTGGKGNGFFRATLDDDNNLVWSIGDKWNSNTLYAKLNDYSQYNFGDYHGGIMMNNNNAGFLISNPSTSWLLKNLQDDGTITFTQTDIDNIQEPKIKAEIQNLATKYKEDTKFKELLDKTIAQVKSDAALRKGSNQYTDLYTGNGIDGGGYALLKPGQGDHFIQGLFNYGKNLDDIQEVNRWNDGDMDMVGIESIARAMQQGNTNLKNLDYRNVSGAIDTEASKLNLPEGTVIMGFYDPNTTDADIYDEYGYAKPNKADRYVGYNPQTGQYFNIDKSALKFKKQEDINADDFVPYDGMRFMDNNTHPGASVDSDGQTFKAVKSFNGSNGLTWYIGLNTSSKDRTYHIWCTNQAGVSSQPRRIHNKEAILKLIKGNQANGQQYINSIQNNIIETLTNTTNANGGVETWTDSKYQLFNPDADFNKLIKELKEEGYIDREDFRDYLLNEKFKASGKNRQEYVNMFDDLINFYINEGLIYYEKKGGKIPRFQYGGKSSKTSTHNVQQVDTELDSLDRPESFVSSATNFKDLSNADKTALIATIGDLLSTATSFIPGLNLASAAVGLGASGAHFVADIKRDGFQLRDLGNLGINVGLDILSTIPIASGAIKTGKLARMIKSISSIAAPMLMASGMYGAAAALKKARDEGFTSLSNEEVSQLFSGLAGLRGALKGGRAISDRVRVARNVNAGKTEVDLSKGVKLKPKTGDEVKLTSKAGDEISVKEVKIDKTTAEKLNKATDGVEKRKIIEEEFKKSAGSNWEKLSQGEKNKIMSQFMSDTEGVDFSVNPKSRAVSWTPWKASKQNAAFNIAAPTDISRRKAGWQALWSPSKVSLQNVANYYGRTGKSIAEMPAYMQRYIKNEYAKMGNYGVGSMYATGDPKYKMWKFPFGNRFANFLGYGRRAQKAPAETPWKLEIDNRWWKGWGPNKRYTLVDIPKQPKEMLALPPYISNLPNPSNFKVEIPKVVEGNVYGYVQRPVQSPVQSPALPNTNTNTPQSKLLQRSSVDNTAGQRNIFIKNTQSAIIDNNGKIKNDLKLSDLSDKIKNIKPKQLQNNGVLTKNTNGLTIEQIIKSYMKKYNGRVSESQIISIILNRYIRFGKSGMKIPKYQLTPGPLPSFKDVLNKSTLDFQTNLNNLSGSTSINPDLIQQKAELNLKINNPEAYKKLYGVRDNLKETFAPLEARKKVADDLGLQEMDRVQFMAQPYESSNDDSDDDAGKGAFMKKLNLSNIFNPENLLKASQYISNASMARKIHDRTDDMLNEAAKYRTPNINERYTQFFDDGATSAWERSKAVARSNLNNMQTSDSRLNMAAALDLEGKLMQGDENLRQYNTSRYADWLKTNNEEHKIYDQFRYNVAKENTMRDADLMRMKAQNDVNLMSSLQEMRNNAFADVITTVQNDKAVKDDIRQSRLQNEISRQAEAKMRELIPQYFSDPNYQLTNKDQMIMQQISNEMKALLDAYNYNNRASFDKVKIPTTQTG